jgi:hypothetical protein
MYNRYLDDSRPNGQNQVEPVMAVGEEASPIGQLGKNADDDLDIEKGGNRQFAFIQDRLMQLADINRPSSLYDKRCKSEEDPTPSGIYVYDLEMVIFRDMATIHNPTFIPIIYHGIQSDKTKWLVSTLQQLSLTSTYGAAPKALLFVSDRIAEKVFVMTATKRLISQKLRTTMQTMKKQHETKNSASIIAYIMGDHWMGIVSSANSKSGQWFKITHAISRRDDDHLERSEVYCIEALHVTVRVLSLLI